MPLRFLCDTKETKGAWSLMEEDIPLGMGPSPHRHDWDEAYYVTEGVVNFEIDGKQVRLERGDFAYFPRNTVHAFKGASPAPGSSRSIFAAPGHSSEFFEEVNREVLKLPDDLTKVPAIGERHGIEFMPAPVARGRIRSGRSARPATGNGARAYSTYLLRSVLPGELGELRSST